MNNPPRLRPSLTIASTEKISPIGFDVESARAALTVFSDVSATMARTWESRFRIVAVVVNLTFLSFGAGQNKVTVT